MQLLSPHVEAPLSAMAVRPEREEFLRLAREHNLIAVAAELVADMDTPISLYRKLVGEGPGYLLESVEGGENVARYSFVGAYPELVVRAEGDAVTVAEPARRDHLPQRRRVNPFLAVRQLLSACRPAPAPRLPRFYGGLVGYLGYDLVRHVERLPHAPPDDRALPDMVLMAAGIVAIVDHVSHRLTLVRPVHVRQGDASAAYRDAVARLEAAAAAVRAPLPTAPAAGAGAAPGAGLRFSVHVDRATYEAAVRRAKEHILAGDIFQVVLSQRVEAEFAADPLDCYRALRGINPSPYMYYLNCGDLQIAGSSPELLVRLEDGVVSMRPIAGTRRRGRSPAEDEALAAELLADEKERAEHVMLVDLGRNDLGRVCRYGSVRVSDLMRVERYSHVMHIVSDVRGEIAPGKDAIDVLTACFPAGTLSGAPKVRAMQIIDELETVRRGPYGGAVGYLGYQGNMDTAIAIRTVVFHAGKAYVQAGAGIVADSDPAREYQECLDKAMAVVAALQTAAGGLPA